MRGSAAWLLCAAALLALPLAPAQPGCTVPTAQNFNASARLDDGSCLCRDHESPDGEPCAPLAVVVPVGVSAADGRPDALCSGERNLTCMKCDAASHSCTFQCEDAAGEGCSRLRLDTAAFDLRASTTKKVYLATVLVLILLVTVSVLIDGSSLRWLQESMAYIFIGAVLGSAVHLYAASDPEQSARDVFTEHIEFNGNIFFYILLPPIILDSGYNMSKANFFRNIDSILAFALAGTIISAVAVGMILYLLDRDGVLESQWEALQFGAVISATDPVASLSVIAKIGQLRDRNLHNLIFGEAVLNDAIAIVLFTVFSQMDAADTVGAQFAGMLQKAAGVLFGSLGIGLAVGAVSALITHHAPKHFADEPHVEISQMFLAAYGSYLVADYMEMSGIISLFSCAIMLSHYTKYNLCEGSRIIVKATIHTVAFVSEACIFVYLGIDFVLGVEWARVKWSFVALTVAACLIGRATNIFPLSALLNVVDSSSCRRGRSRRSRRKDGADTQAEVGSPADASERQRRVPAKSQFVLWFAGLRGPIAYGLAKKWRAESTDPDFQQIVSTTIIICVLSTFVCGGTFGWLLDCLDMEVPEEERQAKEEETLTRESDLALIAADTPDTAMRSSLAAHTMSPLPAGRPNYDYSPHAVLPRDSQSHEPPVEAGRRGLVTRFKAFDDGVLKKYLGGKDRGLDRSTSLQRPLQGRELFPEGDASDGPAAGARAAAAGEERTELNPAAAQRGSALGSTS